MGQGVNASCFRRMKGPCIKSFSNSPVITSPASNSSPGWHQWAPEKKNWCVFLLFMPPTNVLFHSWAGLQSTSNIRVCVTSIFFPHAFFLVWNPVPQSKTFPPPKSGHTHPFPTREFGLLMIIRKILRCCKCNHKGKMVEGRRHGEGGLVSQQAPDPPKNRRLLHILDLSAGWKGPELSSSAQKCKSPA